MSFNYPQFLWALTALAIPIIIHLFNFRRTTRVYFSSTRFLKQVQQETTQQRKLKKYLVLASRLLFIFFLVLAFAQPFLPAHEQLTDQRNLIIYLDNSYSMSVPVQEKVRALDAGLTYVRGIVDLFPAETRYKLITNDFAPFSNNFKSKAEISDLLSQVRLSPVSRSFQEIAQRIGNSKSTLFWISDFQTSTLGETPAPDSTWQIRLVPIAYPSISNVFVDSVWLDNPFIIGGEKNSIHVRLHNQGPRPLEGLVTRLTIAGVQAATTAISIEANSLAETSFDLSGDLKGFNPAVVSFSDYPVSFDNEFNFALNYSGLLKVVEVKQDTRITHVQQVYGNTELFSFKTFSTGNVDYSALADADVVILNGVNRIDGALNAALQNYRTNNGTLLVIPGMQPDLADYRQLLAMPQLALVVKPDRQVLDRPDFQNPFFEHVFEERTTAMAMPAASAVWEWGTDRSAILKFVDGRPYLSRIGSTFLLGSSLDIQVSDLANHAIFVPIMYRLAASGKKADRKPYYYLSSALITVPADSLSGDEPARMKGKQELVPPQRRSGNGLILEIPRHSVDPGFYFVTHGSDTLDMLAFNMEKAESELQQLNGEAIKTRLGGGANISFFEATSTDSFNTEIEARYLGKPLWKYAIFLALLFLLAEVLLIRFLK